MVRNVTIWHGRRVPRGAILYPEGVNVSVFSKSATLVELLMHVAEFTRHPSSGVAPAKGGTYAGLLEKIPHLTDLGVTAVEFLPVFQCDAQDAPPGRVNSWGAPCHSARLIRDTALARTREAPWTSSAT